MYPTTWEEWVEIFLSAAQQQCTRSMFYHHIFAFSLSLTRSLTHSSSAFIVGYSLSLAVSPHCTPLWAHFFFTLFLHSSAAQQEIRERERESLPSERRKKFKDYFAIKHNKNKERKNTCFHSHTINRQVCVCLCIWFTMWKKCAYFVLHSSVKAWKTDLMRYIYFFVRYKKWK